MKRTVSETAKLTGVSVRTLRYYDEIGLLKPSELSPAGYRFYDDEALGALQQILFYRELGFPLEQIGAILRAPDHDRTKALQDHRALLLKKRERLTDLLRLVDETIGGAQMYDQKPHPTRAELEELKQACAREAEERWGDTEAYRQSRERQAGATPEERDRAQAEMEDIFRAFARCDDPADPECQALVERWKEHITRYHYRCTDRILAGLGEMYAADARFRENLDAYGPGTARRMSRAIEIYCKH